VMTKVDPASLGTVSRVNMAEYLSIHTITAHPHLTSNGDVLNMGVRFSRQSNFVFCRTNIEKKKNGKEAPIEKTELIAEVSIIYVFLHDLGLKMIRGTLASTNIFQAA